MMEDSLWVLGSKVGAGMGAAPHGRGVLLRIEVYEFPGGEVGSLTCVRVGLSPDVLRGIAEVVAYAVAQVLVDVESEGGATEISTP